MLGFSVKYSTPRCRSPARARMLCFMGLNPKYKKFADHYLATDKKKEAAIVAGFSPKSAHTEASRLLRKPEIAKYIAQRVTQVVSAEDTEKAKTNDLSARVIKEMETLAF